MKEVGAPEESEEKSRERGGGTWSKEGEAMTATAWLASHSGEGHLACV